MIILFITGLILGAFSVVFALQNTAIVTVKFFSFDLTASLSVIISLAVISGILVAMLLFVPESIKNYFKLKKLKRENGKLADQVNKQKEVEHFKKSTPPTQEDLERVENGVVEDRVL